MSKEAGDGADMGEPGSSSGNQQQKSSGNGGVNKSEGTSSTKSVVSKKTKDPATLSDAELREQLQLHFRHTDFKSKLQQAAIREVLARKHDVYISMPTGAGKSLCFQLPGLLHSDRVTVVFSPLLALIKDQIDHLQRLRIRAESINSAMAERDRQRVLADLRSRRPDTRFLYITPEQGATEKCRAMLLKMHQFDRLAYFAVDEAHCVSEWGHSFRRDYLRLGELRSMFPRVPWIALTATASKEVVRDIVKQLRLQPEVRTFKVSCFRKNLFYDVVFKEAIADDFKHLREYALRCMGTVGPDVKANQKPCGIIYCRTREDVERVAHGLTLHGVPSRPYHSKLDAKTLKAAQEDWMAGQFPVICATIAFGMGVDKATVRFVVHWDVPQTVANYYQESGRAGRDGLRSHCRVYYCRQAVRSITHLLKTDAGQAKGNASKEEQAKRAMKDFEQMCTYCETLGCRHRLFSNYFGDEPPDCRRMCDVCADKKGAMAALEGFQKLAMNMYTGGRISAEDGSDLYGGGREGARAETEAVYGGSGGKGADGGDSSGGEEYGTSSARALAKQQTASLIQREFALRKVAAAAVAEMMPSARLAKCRASTSTGVKVAGLTISVRESYLGQMAELLKANYEKCADVPADEALKLRYIDFEDVASVVEYECFTKNKVAALYRRSCAVASKAIKNDTEAGTFYERLRQHVPKQRAVLGGDVHDMQRRLGELDAKTGTGSEVKKAPEKRQARSGFKADLVKQTTLGAYFSKSVVVKKEKDAEEATVLADTPDEIPINLEVPASIEAQIQAQLAAARRAEEEVLKETEASDVNAIAIENESPNPAVLADPLTEESASIHAQIQAQLDAARLAEQGAQPPNAEPPLDNEAIRREIEANRLEIERTNAELKRLAERPAHESRSKSSHKSHKERRRRSRSSERKDKKDKVKDSRRRRRSTERKDTKEDQKESRRDRSRSPQHKHSSKRSHATSKSSKSDQPSVRVKTEPVSPKKKNAFEPGPSRCVSPRSDAAEADETMASRLKDFDDEMMYEVKVEEIKREPRGSSVFSFDSVETVINDGSNMPKIPHSDEPTAGLDAQTGAKIIKTEPSDSQPHSGASKSHMPKESRSSSSKPADRKESSSRDKNSDRSSSHKSPHKSSHQSSHRSSHKSSHQSSHRSSHKSSHKSSSSSSRTSKSQHRDRTKSPAQTSAVVVKTEPRHERASSVETVINYDRGVINDEFTPLQTIPEIKTESRLDRASSVDTVINTDLSTAELRPISPAIGAIKTEPLRERASSVDTVINEEHRDERAQSAEIRLSEDGEICDTDADTVANCIAVKAERLEPDETAAASKSPSPPQAPDVNRSDARRSKERKHSDRSSPQTPDVDRLDGRLDRNHHRRDRRHRDSSDRDRSGRRRDSSSRHRSHRSHKKSKRHRRDRSSDDGDSDVSYKRPKTVGRSASRASSTSSSASHRRPSTADDLPSGINEDHKTTVSAQPAKLSLSDTQSFNTMCTSFVDHRARAAAAELAVINAEIERRAEAKRAEVAKLNLDIAIQQEHLRRQRDDTLAAQLQMNDLECMDDNEALSNPAAARIISQRRQQRAEEQRRAGVVNAGHVSLHDQLTLNDLDQDTGGEAEQVLLYDAEMAQRVAEETDYERMDLNGRVKEMERRFGKQIPRVLQERMMAEKTRVSDLVAAALLPYENAGRIVPKVLCRDLRRKISHMFYGERSEDGDIQNYVKRIFVRLPCVRSLRDVDESKFL